MITASPAGRQHPPAWQVALADAITDPRELLALLDLDPTLAPPALLAAGSFALRVPRGYVARMRRGDPADPLLLQVLPRAGEMLEAPGFSADPLHEAAAQAAPGLLRKYPGRALLVTTAACGVHCRYCFRREFPYARTGAGRWRQALAALAADSSIEEVVLSGGDPLALTDARLAELSACLAAIAHVRRLRIHTRQPIVLPERVDGGLQRWLAGLRSPPVIVLHANHANEIDVTVMRACERLRACGAVLLNQSVLLRDINDTPAALAALAHRLADCGVLPYYLHLLDRVRGTSHFEVEQQRAVHIVRALSAMLPGYLVPRLVREIPGETAKHQIATGRADD
jgi:EF-P beta-lysylation protein EpmB